MRHAVERAASTDLADAADVAAVIEGVDRAGPFDLADGHPLAVLLVQVRHARRGALIAKASEPLGVRRSGLVLALVGLSARDDPVEFR